MKWMDSQELEQVIFKLRKKEFNDVKNKYVKENIQMALKIINELKENCLQKIQFSEQNAMECMTELLKTEAEIVNIIGISIYGDFRGNRTIKSYLERESKYAYREYIKDIDYYADDYQSICFLAKFYTKTKTFNI
ncbi:hypothetical protein [Enterococcus mundtii]|uniref:hypothetical protein n=1 Tax=Enterococcus mundtii TaxID=53346 RepID=UPI000E033203|nr:hypothetical protein [Enterococcus mundtii]STE38095.1 Uncharacterised protein [Enterococcus mundtii]